jgi:hypothetical protein
MFRKSILPPLSNVAVALTNLFGQTQYPVGTRWGFFQASASYLFDAKSQDPTGKQRHISVTMFAGTLAILLVGLFTSSAALSEARWKVCGNAGAKPTCTTACGWIIASFPTYEQCAAAKKAMRFTPSKTKQQAKSAGSAGMAECKRRYGKNVSSATLSSDGKTLLCHGTSDDPIVARDACKKRYGPMSQLRRHRGKWYCTA